MKKITILLLYSLKLFSQNEISEGNIEELKKNIIAYHIKCSDNFDYKNKFLDCDWTLNLDIKKIKDTIIVQNKNWMLYKVINDNFTFYNKNVRIMNKMLPIHGQSELNKISVLFLIAINENQEIIYIGGNFYKTSIADKFDISINNYQSFFYFIKLKLFNYDLKNLKLLKNHKEYLFFKGYSNILSRVIKIKLNKNNFDDITIIKEDKILQ